MYSARSVQQIKVKSITHNIFRIQSDDSVMFGFYCIAFMEYLISGKTLLIHTKSISLNNYQKNDKIIISNLKTNMTKGNVSLEIRQKKNKTKNCLLEKKEGFNE